MLSYDLIDQILKEEAEAQQPADFGLERKRNVREAIDAAYIQAQGLWTRYEQLRADPKRKAEDTTETREKWLIPFLKTLGYQPTYNPAGYDIGGDKFPISHRADPDPGAPPIHLIAFDRDLDRVDPSGRPRYAPHTLMQEFLNRSEEALWGIIANGRTLRILRDSTYLRKQSYIEFDLQAIFEQQLYQDFALLFRLAHRSRFPKPHCNVHECPIEQYYNQSIEQGGRIRERLRDGVEQAIQLIANGLIAQNEDLRRRLRPEQKHEHPLTAAQLYQDLLRVVYRFLFLLVSEDRKILGTNELYQEAYSVSRFRRLIEQTAHYNEHQDLWISLKALWKLLRNEESAPAAKALGLPVLNGALFHELDIERYDLDNRTLLQAMSHLLKWTDTESKTIRRVNYGALDVEELGSVYESLLDLHPTVHEDQFEFSEGQERKSTGSYYTPAELVQQLIDSALKPVLEEKLRPCATPEAKEEALLSLSVVDPACGSGHFLLAAARSLGKTLAQIRKGQEVEPTPAELRNAIRDVVSHCIYGVDLNPLAVELCKVALWIESYTGDKPLTFLDHHIQCGNSLVGVLARPDQVEHVLKEIPSGAYNPVSGDDKQIAEEIKRRNAQFLKSGQRTLTFEAGSQPDRKQALHLAQQLRESPEDDLEQVRQKEAMFRKFEALTARDKTLCDLWTAAFFQKRALIEGENRNDWSPERFLTSETLFWFQQGEPIHPQALADAEQLATTHRFFHWHLRFPEVFERGGFDVVLGNPPWERIKLQEKEFFEARSPDIANAPNAAKRKRLIQELKETDPGLYQEYAEALHDAEASGRFLRASGAYEHTARGDINTYSVFAERMRKLKSSEGAVGVIVPTGIATDDTNKRFFADLVQDGELVSLYDFDNRAKLFPDVISLQKFCLLTLGSSAESEFAFFCHRASDLMNHHRKLRLSAEEIALLNPNTRTLPILRTRQDAELLTEIYRRVPVLVLKPPADEDERAPKPPTVNPWRVGFLRMFDMANDSHLFHTRRDLSANGGHLVGNRFQVGGRRYLPLYEAKMIWHYDHRYGTYEGSGSRSSTQLPTPGESDHARADYVVQPWYWVEEEETLARITEFEDLARALYAKEDKPDRQPTLAQALAGALFRCYLYLEAGGHTDPNELRPIVGDLGRHWRQFVERHPFLRDAKPAETLPRRARYQNEPVKSDPEQDSWLPDLPFEEVLGGESSLAKVFRQLRRMRRVLEIVASTDEQQRTATRLLGWKAEQLPPIRTEAEARAVAERLVERAAPRWRIGFRKVARATDERTGIFSVLPRSAVGDSMPLLAIRQDACRAACLIGNLTAIPFDWATRLKLGGVNLNFFYVEQLPVLRPDAYGEEERRFVVPRVLELVYTAWDVKPFADDVWLDADEGLREAILAQRRANAEAAGGAPEPQPPDWLSAYPEIEVDERKGIPFSPFRWISDRRAILQAELDAYFARLYGLNRKQLRYILDPADLTEKELEEIRSDFEEVADPLDEAGYAARRKQSEESDFPGETFRVLRDKELRSYREYRTRRLVLEAWERLGRSTGSRPPGTEADHSDALWERIE
jgi:hypothetical protein